MTCLREERHSFIPPRRRERMSGRKQSEHWTKLREQSIRVAVRCGGSRQPEDDAQEAILRTLEAEARGTKIRDYPKYISSSCVAISHSEQRRLRVKSKHANFLKKNPELWIAEELQNREEIHSQSIRGLCDIAREIGECLDDYPHQLPGGVFSIILCDDSTSFKASQEMSSSTNKRISSFKRFSSALRERGILLGDLFNVLRAPRAVFSDPGLTLIVANSVASIIQRLQMSSKKCRLDILYRTGLDRQDLHIPKLAAFTKNLDDMYAAASVPREYAIIGIVVYLERLLKIEHIYRNLINLDYAEFLALEIIRNKPYMNPIDRWLAIVLLGVIYNQARVDREYAVKMLSPIEQIAERHSIQKIGMAFAWVNAIKEDKHEVIRDKVYPLLTSARFPGGLSQLPITVIGAYMGSSPDVISSALAVPETWQPILLGLQSKSYLANLGALAQLSYMQLNQPPLMLRDELKSALKKVTVSPIPLIRQRTHMVPHQYRE